MNADFTAKRFEELTTAELYEILRARGNFYNGAADKLSGHGRDGLQKFALFFP